MTLRCFLKCQQNRKGLIFLQVYGVSVVMSRMKFSVLHCFGHLTSDVMLSRCCGEKEICQVVLFWTFCHVTSGISYLPALMAL